MKDEDHRGAVGSTRAGLEDNASSVEWHLDKTVLGRFGSVFFSLLGPLDFLRPGQRFGQCDLA
jgi:hypothetical protein